MARPVIGITMGDAAGIGPEIVVKALNEPQVYDSCHPILIGELDMIRESTSSTSEKLKIRVIESPAEMQSEYGTIDLLDMKNLSLRDVVVGQANANCGEAAMACVSKAADLAKRGELDAITTAPISKHAINLAGYEERGHTEFLARYTGTSEYAMMMIGGPLRVALVTTHLPLAQVCQQLDRDRILSVIKLTHQGLVRLGIEEPRVAVAAINPHAGEAGLLGREEIEVIGPAVEAAEHAGIPVEGPLPADSVFHLAYSGQYDAVVVMYHDQGLIPLKMVAFDKAVNVTLGLPFVRTSVGHGTAFDIAGKGVASCQSLLEAIKIASRMTGV